VKLTGICGRLTLIGLLLALSACGGDGGGSSPPPNEAQVSTLAYVVTRCHEEKGGTGWAASQALWVRQGDREPVKIKEYPGGPPPIGGFCRLWGNGRDGASSTVVGTFQRLGVSPDGALVVFEVTDDFSVLTPVVPAEEQGFFAVRPDGSGLHKVADHSNDPAFRVAWGCAFANARGCSAGNVWNGLEFSPNGRRVVYTDLGPSDTGEEAPQVFTLDLTTNEHQQVTFLPRLPECHGQSDDPPDCVDPVVFPTFAPSFLAEKTILYSRGRGSNEVGGGQFTVKLNAHGDPDEPQTVPVVAGPNGVVIPVFEITGVEAYGMKAVVPGRTPVDGGEFVEEMFVVELPNAQRPDPRVLQLTNFERSYTGQGRITPDAQRVLFVSGADPFGTNPGNQGQWFSIDRLGSDLRQLTSFGVVGEGGSNCENLGPNGTILG